MDGRRWKVDGRPEACFTGSFILFVIRKRILPRRAVKDPAAFVAGYRKTNLICPGTGGSKRQRITLKSKKTRRILQRKAKQVQRCKREWSRKERDVRRVRQDFSHVPFCHFVSRIQLLTDPREKNPSAPSFTELEETRVFL